MTFEQIEHEAAELIRKFPSWKKKDRQENVMHILLSVYSSAVQVGWVNVEEMAKNQINHQIPYPRHIVRTYK